MSSIVKLLYGEQTARKVAQAHLLIVGVGGIGCELLKALSKSGFKRLTILDLDHIEQTNLNRQFYFRKWHVGKSKAQVGKECLLEIDPSIEITSICDSIFSVKYGIGFFSQFDVIVSALDNMAARRHLSAMVMKVGKVLIDAGTEGFSGQAKAVVRGLNDCHQCTKQGHEQSFAVCTIRNQPQRPVHCIAYGKSLYDGLFGDDKLNPLKGELNLNDFMSKNPTDQQIREAGGKLFDILFYQKISNKTSSQGSDTPTIFPLKLGTALAMNDQLKNPPTTFNQNKFKKQQASLYAQEKILSPHKYAQMFVQAFYHIIKDQKDQLGTLKFEKDDKHCMRFVYAVTTLRTYNFMQQTNKHNKHEYLSYYDCKDVAGKIVAAISTTNSIAAAIQTSDILRVLSGNVPKLRYVSFNAFRVPRIQPSGFGEPMPDCNICSLKSLYLHVQCDFHKVSYRDLEQYLLQNFSYRRNPTVRDLEGRSISVEFEPEDDGQKDIKLIETMKNCIVSHPATTPLGAFEMQFVSQQGITPVNLNVQVVNVSGVEGIQPRPGSERDQNAKQILRYITDTRGYRLDNQEQVYKAFGFI